LDFELTQILSFYRHAEARFTEQASSVEKEMEELPPEAWKSNEFGFSNGDQFQMAYEELVDLHRLNDYFGILMTYAVLERFLLDFVQAAKLEVHSDYSEQEKMTIDDYADYLLKFKIDIRKLPFDYSRLRELYHRRNLIMHRGATLPGYRKGESFFPERTLQIQEGYVRESVLLVGQTAQFVEERYSQLLTEIGWKSPWDQLEWPKT
jgi:hypothetical protein